MFLPHSQISARPKKTTNGVGPLLETEWGQGGLYQTFTPRITKSWDPEVWLGQAYLGCTTVATAQVLNYYGYQNIKYLERYQEYSNCYTLGNHQLSGLKGKDVEDLLVNDRLLIECDGTENKNNLGANAILAVSMACAKAASISKKIPLYEFINDKYSEFSGKKVVSSLPLKYLVKNIISKIDF